jgi:enoyl-CoA hydratase/carnithine racemase
LIITGSGDRAFAAGADVAELADRPPLIALDGLVQGILLQLESFPFRRSRR